MQLTDAQKQQVGQWIDSGAKLSEIQSRLDQELGLRLTYMDVRLLVDDLRLTPKDTEEAASPEEKKEEAVVPAASEAQPEGLVGEEEVPAGSGGVSVNVDQLARPGALVSGKVTFSDGQSAEWYLDQFGRLGLVPAQQGYRPPEQDVAEFQMALEKELMKRGF